MGTIAGLLGEMNQSVGGTRGALQVAGDSCVTLEKNSVNNSEASEAIRCSIADII